MTIEIGDPGIPGFGYGSQGTSDQTGQAHRAGDGQTANAPGTSGDVRATNGGTDSPSARAANENQSADGRKTSADAQSDDHAEAGEEVASSPAHEQIPGLETSASDCFNRAAQIARSLNHANLSSDHLMLALTLDQNARRLLERVGDVAQLREAAMRKLGKNHTKFSRDIGKQPLPPTADLDDLGKAAREAAAERDQSIAISDLINAFPKVDGRLTYAAGEGSRAVAVIDTIEKGLVPRVDDAVTRIERAVFDAMQRQHQSVQSILQDLNSRQSQEWERRQSEFMDEIRRQVREAADIQLAVALKDLNDKFETKRAEPEAEESLPDTQVETFPQIEPQEETIAVKDEEARKSSWGWLSLIL